MIKFHVVSLEEFQELLEERIRVFDILEVKLICFARIASAEVQSVVAQIERSDCLLAARVEGNHDLMELFRLQLVP